MNIAKKFLLLSISFLLLIFPLNNIKIGQPEQKNAAEQKVVSIDPNPAALTVRADPVSTEINSKSTYSVQAGTIKFPEKGVPVLMYHSISYDPQNTLCVPEKQLTEEMEWLQSQNYHSITVDQFYQAFANGEPLPDKPVLITFDDGYKDNYQAGWPILKKYGFVGTFFIITNAINPNRIDWDQLKDLVNNGNSIGSHTVHHLDLSTLKDSQQESELADSKKVLEEHLGIKINSFCYPAGKYNQTTITLLTKLGYKIAFTTASGRAHQGDNPYKLTRLRISGGMPLSTFKSLLT